MAEQKESSVLFSLKELMNLEENRIKEEEQEKDRRARAEAERRAREDAERRAAEERRLREEEEVRRAEDLRKKEESTRLDAIRMGEIEKAKAEAEHQARMQALAAHQAHEQHIAALASDSTKKRLKLIVGVVSGVLVVGGIVTAVLVNKANQEQAKRDAIALAERQRVETAQKQALEELQKLKSDQEALQSQLSNAKDEAARKEIEAKIAASKAESETKAKAARTGGGGPRSGGGSKKAGSDCNCPPGDPLCSCL
jgi:colicin import membrane protein